MAHGFVRSLFVNRLIAKNKNKLSIMATTSVLKKHWSTWRGTATWTEREYSFLINFGSTGKSLLHAGHGQERLIDSTSGLYVKTAAIFRH